MEVDDAMDEDVLRVRGTQVGGENTQRFNIGAVRVVESRRVDQIYLAAIELKVENAKI